ncbi:MAG: 2Fe-2S iron-sulfur cluster-binding protein [Chitinispirillia bacterium]
MFTVVIDDKKVRVEPGSTILSAAQKAGIWIPTLCYHPSVSNLASCRICMVELDRGDWKQLVTACNYPVRGDIKVSVSSENAVRARQGVMELLLARSSDSYELKVLAKKMGVIKTPYPKVTESQRNCILCGLCILVCEEVIGQSAIGFCGRGVDRTVATPFRMASKDCIGCGACAAVCPVGTIKLRTYKDTGEVEISPFKSRSKLLVCEGCGTNMVTEPVSRKMLKQIKVDWKEFKKKARLCPKCRRLEYARSVEPLSAP